MHKSDSLSSSILTAPSDVSIIESPVRHSSIRSKSTGLLKSARPLTIVPSVPTVT
nr:MAG TPA: hypothetical protein [Caudoviricetes sp.]